MKNHEIPEMVFIPGSAFINGDIWGDGDKDEQPNRQIDISSFELGKYTVTNRQFALFLNDIKTRNLNGHVFIDITADARNSPICQKGDAFICKEGLEDYPVTNVSWIGAVHYCNWLTEKTDRLYRLPTEDEWQYASMGPHKLKWSLGNEFHPSEYVCKSKGPCSVDFGKPSDFGAYNMTGNVFEWCSDEYSFSLERTKETILKNNRVIKGGAFILGESANFRNAKKFSCYQTSCLKCIGFRVVSEIEESTEKR